MTRIKEHKIALPLYQMIDKEFRTFYDNLKEILGEDLNFVSYCMYHD